MFYTDYLVLQEQKKKLSDQQRRQTSKDIRLSAFTGDHDVQVLLPGIRYVIISALC